MRKLRLIGVVAMVAALVAVLDVPRGHAAGSDLVAPFFGETNGTGYASAAVTGRHIVLSDGQQWRNDTPAYSIQAGAAVAYTFVINSYTDDNALIQIVWRAAGREIGRSVPTTIHSQQAVYSLSGVAPATADSYNLRLVANADGTARSAPLDLYISAANKAGSPPEWGGITNLWPTSTDPARLNENATLQNLRGDARATLSQQTFSQADAGQIFSYRARLTSLSSYNAYLVVYFLNGNGQEISRAVDWITIDKVDYVLTGLMPPNTARVGYGLVVNTGATRGIGDFTITLAAVSWQRGAAGSSTGKLLSGGSQTPTTDCRYSIQGNIYPARSIFSPRSNHQMGADWALFYSGWDGDVAGGKRCFNDRIYKAMSKDGRTWQKAPVAIVSAGADGTWDCKHVSDPDVVAMPDGRYFLYYTGYNDGICAPTLPARDLIGLAISSDGGTTFVKYDSPVLGLDDPTVNQNPIVQRIGNTYYMWVTHTYEKEYTYRWQSSDGIHWGGKQRVADAGAGLSIVYPDIEQEANGGWVMYYIGAPANMTPAYRGSLERAFGVNVGAQNEAWIRDDYFNVPNRGMFDYFDIGGSMQATGRIASPRRQIVYAAGNQVDNSLLYLTDAPDRL